MPTIDNLDIQISTSLSNSDKMLDSMIAKCGALASSLGSINGQAGSLNSGMTRVTNTMNKSGKSVKSLASMYGKFYANYFQVIRGIKSLNRSIQGTADYIEAFNYFEVSFNKIANDWKEDFSKYGYDAAEEYAESFNERAKESLSKLSGVQINIDADGKGLLTETGMKNLGLNIQEITQYASQLASITNSVGQTGEMSLATANSFTKLAGDISSLFNQDYSAVAKNLQSGLIGQSRALYKYGIDITNATLQTYAYELGLEKAVSEMTQAEKMQLRMIAILDQSKVSWGDLANTINSPSNMIRQFKNNLKETGMILGQLFIPLLQKVLPVVNGVTIAIKRLLVNIAGFLGIELDLSSFGKGGVDLDETYGDLSDSLDDVSESAKKAKAGLRGFDELKTISTPKGSGSGIGGTIDLTDEILKATSEYEKAWEDAYNQMENKAEQFANAVAKYFKPVEKLFKDISVGDWFAVGEDVSSLVSGIFDFFSRAIESVDWERVGTNIGLFLAGINWTEVLTSAFRLYKNLKEALMTVLKNSFEEAPFETFLIVAGVIITKLSKAISGKAIVINLKNILIKGFNSLWLSRWIKTNIAGSLITGPTLSAFSTLQSKFALLSSNLTGFQKGALGIGTLIGEFLLVKNSVEDITKGVGSLAVNITKIGVAATGAGAAFSLVFGFPAGLIATAIVGLVGAIAGITSAMQDIRAKEVGESIKEAFENPGGTPISEVVEKVATSIMSIGEGFDTVNEKSQELKTTNKNIESIWLEIEKVEKSMDAGVLSVEEGSTELSRLFGELAATATEKFDLLETTLLSAYGDNGALAKTMERLGITTESTTNTILQLNDKVEERIKELTGLLASTDPTSPKYTEYRLELSKLIGTTDEASKAISDFEFKVGSTNIDYSGLLADTELDTSKVTNYLTDITDAISTADTDIETGILGIKTSLTEELNAALAIGDILKAEEIQAQLDVLPTALSLLQEDVRIQGTVVADNMQLYFINEIGNRIEKAQQDWEKMNWWQRLFTFCDDADEYAKRSVNKYKNDYIAPLSEEIEKQYSELGINGAGWADEAAEELINGLFDSMTYHSEYSGSKTSYTLKENYKDILNDSTLGLSDLMKEKGKNTVQGYNQGITENVSSTEKETKSWIERVVEKVRSVLDSHSPSRVLKTIGQDTVQGYNDGIKSNQSKSILTVSDFVTKIIKQFSTLEGSGFSIGENLAEGLNGGIKSKTQTIYNSVKKIAQNIAKTMKNALDIHSPSRVMFEIGDFTMQGFDEGLEKWKTPILNSIKSFGNEFEVASADSLGFQSAYALHPNEIASRYRNKVFDNYSRQDTSGNETNRLLKELISAVKNGNVIVLDGKEVGKTLQKENMDYFLRTGNGLFDL